MNVVEVVLRMFILYMLYFYFIFLILGTLYVSVTMAMLDMT